MKQPTVFEGMGMAAVTSLAGATGVSILAVMFGSLGVFRLIIALMSLAYVVYLLLRSPERVGRITVITLWTITTAASFFFAPSLLLYIAIQLGLIWLVRVLYYYHGVLPALLDLGLTGFSLLAAVWAWTVSHSLLLSFWCFFLLQSLFVLIPKQLTNNTRQPNIMVSSDDKFERAHRTAELAVRKLTRL